MCNVTFASECVDYLLKRQMSQPNLVDPKIISLRLREERRRVCPRQLKFAEISGIDNTTLSALENGKQKIRAEHLASLAQAGLDILYVVTGQRAEKSLTVHESRIVALARMMDESALEALVMFVERMTSGALAEVTEPSQAVKSSIHDKSQDYRHG